MDLKKLNKISKRAKDVIVSVFKANKMSMLANVNIEWNNRLTSTAGRAYFDEHKIMLSTKLYLVASQMQRDLVSAHEAAHLVAYYQSLEKSHGPYFKKAMTKAGYKPFEFHDIDYGIPVECNCNKVKYISKNQFYHFKNGIYCCMTCNQEIKPSLSAKPILLKTTVG